MALFLPEIIFHRITEITPSWLAAQGIRGLILDIDNTLTHHDSQAVDQSVLLWLESMKAHGVGLTVLSNNTEERVRPFAQKLGLSYVSNGKKPLPSGMKTAVRRLGLPKQAVAVVGDQIYTDMIGGNLAGLHTILVEPFEVEQGGFLRFKRKFEPIHLHYYRFLQKRGKRP